MIIFFFTLILYSCFLGAMEDPQERVPLLLSQPAQIIPQPHRIISPLEHAQQREYASFKKLFDDNTTLFSLIPRDVHTLIAQQLVIQKYGDEYTTFIKDFGLQKQKAFPLAIQHDNPLISDDSTLLACINDDIFDPNAQDEEYYLAPIVWATLFSRPLIIAKLLENGADLARYETGNPIDMKSLFDRACRKLNEKLAFKTRLLPIATPSCIAIENNDLASLKVLVEQGKSLQHALNAHEFQRAAVGLAVLHKHEEIKNYLQEKFVIQDEQVPRVFGSGYLCFCCAESHLINCTKRCLFWCAENENSVCERYFRYGVMAISGGVACGLLGTIIRIFVLYS